MISKLVEHLLVISSISPVFLAIAVNRWLHGDIHFAAVLLIIFLSIVILSVILVEFFREKLEIISIDIKSVAVADREVAAFLISYILPLLDLDMFSENIASIIYMTVLLYIAMLTTSNYHFNPVLSFLGYHFYEIEVESYDGKSTKFILMTERTILDSNKVKKIVQVSDYMLMEAG